ncbi:MAG: signal peptide peptidase SppA [Desulfamplus sp.]|nr:signal peptide peptidase SppA [Desulfamplus sp.]
MFARRHPYMYFMMVMASIFSLFILSALGIAVGGAIFVNSSIAELDKENAGNVGVIELNGIILSSKDVIAHLKTFRESSDIKAIVIRIDSPGGGVAPSQEIYREIMKTRKEKTVVASLGSVAASGGYYAAASCEGIVASPGTITGSIGVIMQYTNFQELAQKIGLLPVVIKSGEFKDLGSPVRELGDDERLILQSVADEIHMQFVKDAAHARKMEIDDMEELADGRIYTGESALSLKLVDRLGNLDDAVAWAGELAGIEGEIRTVYPREDRRTLLKKMLHSLARTLLKESGISGTVSDHFRFIVN